MLPHWAQKKGDSERRAAGTLGHGNPSTTVGVYMQGVEESVGQALEAIYEELTARPEAEGSFVNGENLVRFGMVGVLDGPQVIDLVGLGA